MPLNSIVSLEENPPNLYLEITSLIIRILDDIIKCPYDPTKRHINLADEIVSNKLLAGIGAMECLFELGFQEGDHSFFLPFRASLNGIVRHRNEIALRRSRYLSTRRLTTDSENPDLHLPILPVRMNELMEKILQFFSYVILYEDPELQKTARSVIPIADLEIAAERNMRRIQLMAKLERKEESVHVQDLLLMELVSWFKDSFYSWVDAPNCSICNGPTKFLRMSDDPAHLAESPRTELYSCESCGAKTPFFRYSDPKKLLQTRRGRCGEWAQCFTLLCRALGFDARLVYDVTDHLWTEVYSFTRWIHVDPCEGVVDAPLMYECGWGKKLSHILSFSVDGVQDVTWRYSVLPPEALLIRRRASGISEEELIDVILKLRQERYKSFSAPKIKYYNRRTASELSEFLWTADKQLHVKDEEKRGRVSGSLAWRLARCETGPNSKSFIPYTWKLSESERNVQQLTVRYSCASDMYYRLAGNKVSKLKCWRSGLYETASVFRKEEKDWKMAYLAREEGAEIGSVKLKFDVSSSGLAVDTISVTCKSATFESGRVFCMLCHGESCIRVSTGEDVKPFRTRELKGAQTFTLEMKLSGGNGSLAWQHAQLFRQPLTEKDQFPLEISIDLMKKTA